MGAVYQETVFQNPTADPQEVRDYGQALIEKAEWDHGHMGYSGSFAEADGVTVLAEMFNDGEEASQWLNDNAEKWGPMLAVKVVPEIEEVAPFWLIGAWCSE